ncbi:MAG: 30S ribosomal protein S8 [Candidatus Omnitrophica bacterium]|nr:30S ribosomal protein S8 [Candidatus Omnitrophota bacterium]MCF7891863.1 30S ribosomal protein S8 [Candidatus Omnitrophota bacterium]MCF7897682.1 30S ribosomal protein S8 [Candidatus Omnitrophota bacterium]MCF7909470.1 30S ribosomal protein S8 [Candidatus Omnitrophota bacterium]
MSRTDLIADAFTIIRNATRAYKEEVFIPYSNILSKICQILKEHEYIENFKEAETKSFKQIKVYLKYDGKKSLISQIKKVSRPSRRIYKKKDENFSVLGGYGLSIISTSKGIFTDKQVKKEGLGGEVIAMVW